jgi:hypothetical protein
MTPTFALSWPCGALDIENTEYEHSGAVVPAHAATIFADERSSLRKSLIFARISTRCCAAISRTSRHEAFCRLPPSGQKPKGMLWRIMLQNEIFRPPVP